ncbi:hypothetical protein C0J52_00692 [Blattella germanica]|nr:hypothetical protein C0J52_00692 [Blattella germanica]
MGSKEKNIRMCQGQPHLLVLKQRLMLKKSISLMVTKQSWKFDKAMPTSWYKMADIMNRYYENYEFEYVWEAGCASLVPEMSKLK